MDYQDWLTFGGDFSGAATGASSASPAVYPSWSDTLKGVFASGVSAYVDSQVNRVGVNDPTYTSKGAVGKAAASAAGNPVVWVGAAVAAVLIFLALRK